MDVSSKNERWRKGRKADEWTEMKKLLKTRSNWPVLGFGPHCRGWWDVQRGGSDCAVLVGGKSEEE